MNKEQQELVKQVILDMNARAAVDIAHLNSLIRRLPAGTLEDLERSIYLWAPGGPGPYRVLTFPDHSFVLHSSEQPAAPDGYYLFNLHLSEQEWCDLLGYSAEEQLIHRLKWGPQPLPQRLHPPQSIEITIRYIRKP